MSDESNGGLDKIQDLLLRQESGQGVVTSCFQYISHVSFLRFPHCRLENTNEFFVVIRFTDWEGGLFFLYGSSLTLV